MSLLGVRKIAVWMFQAFVFFAIGGSASAAGSGPPPPSDPVLAALQGMDDPVIRDLWRQVDAREQAADYLGSNQLLRLIDPLLENAADPRWREARNYYQHSKTLPSEDKAGQLRFLELAIEAAERGLALEPDCTQCMLWKYAALGRTPTLRGQLSGRRDVKTLASLLERGIEISRRDSAPRSRATLAQFYYASASFYRMVPDWFWLPWVVGVRGDKPRALGDARRAVALDPSRTEYQIELAASLLCLGETKDRAFDTREGLEILKAIEKLPPPLSSQANDAQLAGLLLRAPKDACSFSRDGFIDIGSVTVAEER